MFPTHLNISYDAVTRAITTNTAELTWPTVVQFTNTATPLSYNHIQSPCWLSNKFPFINFHIAITRYFIVVKHATFAYLHIYITGTHTETHTNVTFYVKQVRIDCLQLY